jgi:hypothetical protein
VLIENVLYIIINTWLYNIIIYYWLCRTGNYYFIIFHCWAKRAVTTYYYIFFTKFAICVTIIELPVFYTSIVFKSLTHTQYTHLYIYTFYITSIKWLNNIFPAIPTTAARAINITTHPAILVSYIIKVLGVSGVQ